MAPNATPRTAARLSFPSDTETRLVRTFAGPRALVFRAWTDPALLVKWMRPPHCEMTDAAVDLRPGGVYRFTYATPRGEMTRTGEYAEVAPPELLVFLEGWGPDHPVTRTTLLFTEDGAQTTVTMTIDHGTTEARDAALATGFTDLWEHGYGHLDRLLIDAA